MNFLCVNRIQAGYGSRQVLNDISFTAKENTLTGLLGANGCGKTTLIKAICSLIPHSGSCRLDGHILEGMKPKALSRVCSYIPQRSGISIDLSLLDVVLMGFNPHLGLLERPDKSMRTAALHALERAGLSDRADESYLSLSEGQKQLCILARTLVSGGRLLLMDEPESALDFQKRYEMLDLIRSWVSEGGRCALMALHDPQLALNCCDQLLLMDGGRIASAIHPKEDDPARMQAALSQIYGPVSLHRCAGQLVMTRKDIQNP